MNGEAERQEWFCFFLCIWRCQVLAVGLGVFRFSVHTGLVAPQHVRSWFPGQGWNPHPPHCRVAVNRGATRGVPRDECADQQCTLIPWRPNENSHCDTGGLGWAPRCCISNKLPGGFPQRRSFLSVSGVHADPAPGASARQASSSSRIASAGLPPPASLHRPPSAGLRPCLRPLSAPGPGPQLQVWFSGSEWVLHSAWDGLVPQMPGCGVGIRGNDASCLPSVSSSDANNTSCFYFEDPPPGTRPFPVPVV